MESITAFLIGAFLGGFGYFTSNLRGWVIGMLLALIIISTEQLTIEIKRRKD